MKVIVDTCVWSAALREARSSSAPAVLADLIRQSAVEILGPIRQEVLSGIRTVERFQKLRERLRNFPDVVLQREDYEEAASFFNFFRAKGIQGSNVDFLICAAAVRRNFRIYTTDADFVRYSSLIPIDLFQP